MPNVQPKPLSPTNKEDKNDSALKNVTTRVEWFRDENSTSHYTSDYENSGLVLRRGGSFKLGLTFQGTETLDVEETVLRFGIEPKPAQFGNSLYINCGIKAELNQAKWEMKLVSKKSTQIIVEVYIPVNAGIGKYSMDVILPSHSTEPLRKLESASSDPVKQSYIIVLFNPWNEADDVYLEDDNKRKEYVLNDTGTLYCGHAKLGDAGITSNRWIFGQFEENVLDCVLALLNKDRRAKQNPLKSLKKRNSPLWIARILSAVLNCNQDDGVLVGNWSGDYSDGVPPFSWNGSVEIFQQYFKTGQPVKYGQCWVFSAIMTTALRALGIPARSVTNYDSAHDTDENMTIDYYYDEEGEELAHSRTDSFWNFHLWNEIWSKRKDLPNNSYDGWQAVDATPQELSSGLFQMGPAPLKAVKEGEVYAGFDTGFVFGEVNADIVVWIAKQDKNGEPIFQEVKREKGYIGRFISTKMVGKDAREDITRLYKYPEGSSEERKAFSTAYSFGRGPTRSAFRLKTEEPGKELKIELGTKGTGRIGDVVTCTINLKNTSNQTLTVNLTGVVSSMLYTGEVKMLVKRQKMGALKVDVGTSVSKEISVAVDEYLNKLTDLNFFKFVVVAKVMDSASGKQYVEDSTFQLVNKDCIKVNIPKSPLKVGQASEIELVFSNPLPITLSNLTFAIEGIGLRKPIRTKHRELPSGQKETARFNVKPRKPAGVRTLLVDVDSLQVKDFKAAIDVQVVE